MPIDDGTYQNQAVAFATMHGKEEAVAKAFARHLAASITVPVGIDTDALGTFTGEVPRAGTIVEAARAKALLAIKLTGLRCGLGSEGSFGPHPYIPFIPRDIEVLLFVDQENDIEIHETLMTHRTNYQNITCRPGEDISDFLKSIRFPQHAVVVTPSAPTTEMLPIKGVNSVADLNEAILSASHASSDRAVEIVTDMRAHLNPTRMAVIRALATGDASLERVLAAVGGADPRLVNKLLAKMPARSGLAVRTSSTTDWALAVCQSPGREMTLMSG
jgi:hypothetical protein